MNKYIAIFLTGFVLWIAETAFFGWNQKPTNGFEAILDVLSTALIIWGIAGDILSGVTFAKTTNVLGPANVTVESPEKVVMTKMVGVENQDGRRKD